VGWCAVLLLLAVACGTAAAAPVTLKDDLGNVIHLPAPATRIVALAPSATEIAFAAGAGDRLVGVSAYTDWPPAARKLPRVGDAFRIDLERVAALRPGLVVAWASATPPSARRALRRLGMKLVLFAPRKLGDIPREIRLIGKAAGTAKTADRAAAAFARERKRLARAYSGRRPVTVFYEVSARPLYTVGGPQIISQVIRLCGGRNIFSGLGKLAPVVGRSAVLARNPSAILTGGGHGGAKRLHAWQQWPWLAAVKAGNLFTVPGDVLGRPSPRILEGALAVCRDLSRARRRPGAHGTGTPAPGAAGSSPLR